MATKLGRMIASLDVLLPIMLHDLLITWPCEIRGSFTGGGSARKRLSRDRLLVQIQNKTKKFKKLTTGIGEIYTTGCLLDYDYIKNHYRLIAVDLRRQKGLDADPKDV